MMTRAFVFFQINESMSKRPFKENPSQANIDNVGSSCERCSYLESRFTDLESEKKKVSNYYLIVHIEIPILTVLRDGLYCIKLFI